MQISDLCCAEQVTDFYGYHGNLYLLMVYGFADAGGSGVYLCSPYTIFIYIYIHFSFIYALLNWYVEFVGQSYHL